jgi:SAM-dependent methyltransferase
MTRTLDLGCGDKPRNPFHADQLFGVDVRDNLAGNIRSADLVIEPIPFDDNSFDYLTAYDFIEHVPRVVYVPQRRNAFVEVMNEVHRVLKPGGLFLSHTPAYPHGVAFRDPTHVNIITDETFPLYFDDQTRWASIYGFKGAFKVLQHRWSGPHIVAVLQKVAAPDAHPEPVVEPRRISVFIPVHNGERFLSKTLDAALAQTDTDFEIICVDDASRDGSARILADYAARDARLRVVTTPHNLGSAPKALNHALPHMTGSHFVYSSQDDLFSPDWLARMRARAAETGADAVIPDVVLHHDDGATTQRVLAGIAGDRSAVLTGREACRLSLDWSIPGNALWNARLVRQCGFEEFAMNSDEYSVRRLFLACNKVAFCEGRFLYRQDNPDAVTKRIDAGMFDWPLTQLRLAQLLQENGFDAAIVRKEIDAASAHMKRLAQRLDGLRTEWSPAQAARADAAMALFEQRRALKHVFDEPADPGREKGHRLRKWKASLRKLPRKLGLA